MRLKRHEVYPSIALARDASRTVEWPQTRPGTFRATGERPPARRSVRLEPPMKRTIMTSVLTSILSVAAAATAAAQSAYLFVPTIPGEATADGYRNWIEIYSMSQSANDEKASGGCTVYVTKALDKAGPPLWAATVTGQNLGELKINLVQSSGQESRLVYDLVLANARVTSISTSASAGGGSPAESLSITGVSATLSYHPYDGQGQPVTPVRSTITCK